MKKLIAIVALALTLTTQLVSAGQNNPSSAQNDFDTTRTTLEQNAQKTSRQVSDRLYEKIQTEFENTYEKTIDLKS